MKRTLKFLFALLGLILLVSNGCSATAATALQATMIPSSSPVAADACGAENIRTNIQPISDILFAFDDTNYLSNFTQQALLYAPLMEMQAQRRQLDKLTVTPCLEELKQTTHDYMNAVIDYLAYFMGNLKKEVWEPRQKASQSFRQEIDAQYIKLMGASLQSSQMNLPTPTSEKNKTTALATQTASISIAVKNSGASSVNIRKDPNSDGAIIGAFRQGDVLPGFGKSADGQWILVNLNNQFGWVNTSLVELNMPIDAIPFAAIPASSTPTK